MTYVHVLYISLCSITKQLAGSVDHKHAQSITTSYHPTSRKRCHKRRPQQFGDEDQKITIESILDYFAVPFRDFHPETLQGFVCLSILVKCLNLDSMIGQLMWTEICKPTCWSAGEEQFWNPVGGSCCRRIQPHLLRKYCMGYND